MEDNFSSLLDELNQYDYIKVIDNDNGVSSALVVKFMMGLVT